MKQPEQLFVYPQRYPSITPSLMNGLSGYISRVDEQKLKMHTDFKEMDELLYRLLLNQLLSINLLSTTAGHTDNAGTAGKLDPLYERWFKESLAVLQQKGFLKLDGDGRTIEDKYVWGLGSVWKEWEQRSHEWLKHPDVKDKAVLIDTTLRALPAILTGKQLATDSMFPDSSMELVEGIYKRNFPAFYFNEVLAEVVAAYLQARLEQDSSARIRILEIGAGTGGTSEVVLEKLKPYAEHVEEYAYTDISRAFLIHAETQYGPKYQYLKYHILTVESPIAEQGIDAGGYDLVIATNVLHATKDIRNTLRNAKAALQKHGLLVVNEISTNDFWMHLTFGLLHGWWLYTDSELRIPGSPGLYPEAWKKTLALEGFRSHPVSSAGHAPLRAANYYR